MDNDNKSYSFISMQNETSRWSDDTVPYICWDRKWTVAEIRNRLRLAEGVESYRLKAWLMRELKTTEVWFFLKPADIDREFASIKPWLGEARRLWEHLFRMWHELGKL